MEFIAAIALMIALSELREWRMVQRDKKLDQDIRATRDQVSALAVLIEAQAVELSKGNERFEMNQSFVDKASADLESIARMIDVHGIRVKFQPGATAPDYVEGL